MIRNNPEEDEEFLDDGVPRIHPEDQKAQSSRRRAGDEGDQDDDAHRWNSKAKYGLLTVIVMAVCSIRIPREQLGRSASSSSSTAGLTSSIQDRSTYVKEYGISISDAAMSSESGSRIPLSPNLDYLADTNDLPLGQDDVPLFLHVPRCGGSTVKDILGSCHGAAEASDVGARNGHDRDKELRVVYGEHGSRFVNVDTTTLDGIRRAKRMGLVESELADIVVTQYLHPAATLFNKKQRGRLFAMLRHPIERAISLFHYLGVAHWEPTYDPDLGYISIEMYARSKRIEHNWMTRFLSNELHGDLTTHHLAIAKEAMQRKMLVGLLDQKGESWRRFEQYFGWTPKTLDERECRDKLLHWGWSNKHSHPQVEEGSPVWDLLYKQNAFDMELYTFARQLFEEQSGIFYD